MDNELKQIDLQKIFKNIDDLICSKIDVSSNGSSFEPNKEMLFFKMDDLKNNNSFSLLLKLDGSIKIIKNKLILDYDNYEDLKNDIVTDDSMLLDVLQGKHLVKFKEFKNK